MHRYFKTAGLILIILFLWVGIWFLVWASQLEIPGPESFDERVIVESTKIYDRTGKILLYNVHQDIKRRVVPLEEISRHLKNATVAIEDSEFYEHRGFKFEALLRALVANLGAGRADQGGSTITQQLVKNSLLTPEKKIGRKLKELVLAIRLEQRLSKDEILAFYLNEIPYGGNIYGIEEASQAFFGKGAKDLTLAEAAYLAAIPKAPSYYSPYGPNREALEERKTLVLNRMAELGFINEEERQAAAADNVNFLPPENNTIKAPHFVIWVRGQLEEKYGPESIRNRGLVVITSLDWELQQKAEEIVSRFAAENAKNFNAKNAGLVALDPKSGEVLAMVGSRDYFDQDNDGNFNVVLAHRQPGSAFKPFVYAAAFNQGFTPETVVFDVPTQFDTACTVDPSRCYTPENYDGLFRGPVTLRQALAQSINIPALKVLYLAGMKESLALASAAGIKSLTDPERYGLTLVLGGGEVSLLELTSAYGVFANDGIRHRPRAILRVEDGLGNLLEESSPTPESAIPVNTARLVSDILADNEARTPLFGPRSLLYFPNQQVAAKTGTTNNYRDAWIVGYTPNLAVGVWAGNNDNSPMEKKIAGLIVAPMWRAFMDEALPRRPVESFAAPEPPSEDRPPFMRGVWRGNQLFTIDRISGKLATEYTPPATREDKVVTEIHSILYWLGRTDDPQFPLWEEPVRIWAQQHGIFDENAEAVIPKTFDDVHVPENFPEFSLLSPNPTSVYPAGQRIDIRINYSGRYPLARLEAFLNDVYLGAVETIPFRLFFVPNQTENLRATNKLRVIAYDNIQNKKEETLTFRTDLRDQPSPETSR